jgi:tetratricopeptide (TPR) repeat protein
MRRSTLLTLAATLVAPALLAQSPPRRPKLPADADTNDAQAYYDWSRGTVTDWKKVHDAIWWARRLDPSDTRFLFGMWEVMLGRQSYEWQVQRLEGASFVLKSKESRAIDSVEAEVVIHDPFMRYDSPCMLVEGLDRLRDRLEAGMTHYANQCWRQANQAFAEALAKNPSLLDVHVYRARTFYFQRMYDSTIAQLNVVLDSLRQRDITYLTFVYYSKAALEYMIGFTEEHRRHWDAAREAYGRALTEDLSYYMAHAHLGWVALEQHDVKTALAELDLATGLRPDEGLLRHEYGYALLENDRDADAETQLREAIRLEPYWALAHFNLAVALASQGKRELAVAEYEAFIARCPKRLESQAADARSRIERLRG